MKEKALVILICAVFVLSVCSGCGFYVNPQNNFSSQNDNTQNNSSSQDDKTQDFQPVGEPITKYGLSYEEYSEFLYSPSVEYLESNATTESQYFLDKNNDKNIICMNSSVTYSDSEEAFLWRSGISRSLIENWNSKTKVQQWLEENGISGNVESIVFLWCSNLPTVIGVCTDKDWHFVTVNEYFTSEENNEKPHTYRIYSHEEIIEKHGIHDADLLINQEKIATVKMGYDHSTIPLILLFEKAGATIQRDNDVVTVLFKGEKAIFDFSSGKIKIGNGRELGGEDSPGGDNGFSYSNNEFYAVDIIARDILFDFDIELTWDRERREVYVSTD